MDRTGRDESTTTPDGEEGDEEKKVLLTDFILGFDIPGKDSTPVTLYLSISPVKGEGL